MSFVVPSAGQKAARPLLGTPRGSLFEKKSQAASVMIANKITIAAATQTPIHFGPACDFGTETFADCIVGVTGEFDCWGTAMGCWQAGQLICEPQ
jgi:hypothetical protein